MAEGRGRERGHVELKKVGGELVPSWNGKPERFEEYKVRAGIYVKTAEPWKAPQRLGNLIQALEEDAWRVVMTLAEKDREQLMLTFDGFIKFLKDHCQETAVPELGRRLREWQKFRRTKGESMRVFCRRYRTQLGKLESSMRLVENSQSTMKVLNKHIKQQKKLSNVKAALKPPLPKGKVSWISELTGVEEENRTKSVGKQDQRV